MQEEQTWTFLIRLHSVQKSIQILESVRRKFPEPPFEKPFVWITETFPCMTDSGQVLCNLGRHNDPQVNDRRIDKEREPS